ncbi:MarR family winged helix-turn-helix transcriptional regulator [Luedemannella helvata]
MTEPDLGWALGTLLRAYRESLPPTMGEFPHGVRGYQTLCEVVSRQQPSQLALANRLGIDPTVMTYLIDDLVAADLVERRPNPADRRQRQIIATAGGREAIATLCGQVTAAEAVVLAALDEKERLDFRRLLLKAACGHADNSTDGCEAGHPDA